MVIKWKNIKRGFVIIHIISGPNQNLYITQIDTMITQILDNSNLASCSSIAKGNKAVDKIILENKM